jgi:hypothetical protein
MSSRLKSFVKIAPAILLLGLASCAEQTNWQPTVDIANDPHRTRLQTDLAECRQLASHAANQGQTVGEDTAIGAVGGAAGGALLGAIAGGPATGAAIGAVTGTGLGLGGGALSSNATFKRAYIHCMERRGHPVIN